MKTWHRRQVVENGTQWTDYYCDLVRIHPQDCRGDDGLMHRVYELHVTDGKSWAWREDLPTLEAAKKRGVKLNEEVHDDRS